jgi:hypothetical protein
MPKHSTPTANLKTSGSTSTPTKSSSQDNYWEAIEILDQKGDQFLVSWAGIDPETGKQWEPTWVRILAVSWADNRNHEKIVQGLFSKPGDLSNYSDYN